MEIQSAAIIGLGALGILFGHRMPGVQVIAAPARVEKYRAAGPVVCNGREYSFGYVSPAEGRPVDLVLVAVKATQMEQAIRDIRNFVGENTVILSVLNGIRSEDWLEAAYPGHCVWAVAVGMDATRAGRTLAYHNPGQIQFGERDGSVTPRVLALERYFAACGIEHTLCSDILYKQWYKLMVNVGLNQTCAAYGLTYGALRQNREAQAVLLQAMAETIAVANAEGIPLPADAAEGWLNQSLPTLGENGMPSMLQDVRAKRPTELDQFAGVICQKAAAYGIAVPANEALRRRILALEAHY